MNLTVTPAAEKVIRRFLRFDGKPGSGFRLKVAPGGCSGLSAEFSVEAEPQPDDAVIEVNGLKLFLPEESRLLLEGVTIDFSDTPLQSGFVFRDPKQQASSCSSLRRCCSTSPSSRSNSAFPPLRGRKDLLLSTTVCRRANHRGRT